MTGQAEASPWEARIALLNFVLIALAVAVGGFTVLLETAELNTPIQPWVGYVGAAVMGLSAVVTQIISKAGSIVSGHPRFVFWVLVTINVLYVVFAVVAALTHDDRLREGQLTTVEIAAGDRAVRHFAVSSGDHVIVRLRAATPGALLTARAQIGERNELIEQVDPRRWELQTVMVGGDWRLVMDNDGDDDVTVQVIHDRAASAGELAIGTARRQLLSTAGSMNGYRIRADEDLDAVLLLDQLSADDLRLSLAAYEDTRRVGIPAERGDGSYEMPLLMQAGRIYVVAVRALDGATGSYRIRLASDPAGQGDGPDVPDGPDRPLTPVVPETVVLPEVYRASEGEAYDRLRQAGLDVDVIRVCSSSVPAGLVRQAFVLTEGGEEIVVADRPSVIPVGTRVDPAEVVRLKVSTGQPCE